MWLVWLISLLLQLNSSSTLRSVIANIIVQLYKLSIVRASVIVQLSSYIVELWAWDRANSRKVYHVCKKNTSNNTNHISSHGWRKFHFTRPNLQFQFKLAQTSASDIFPLESRADQVGFISKPTINNLLSLLNTCQQAAKFIFWGTYFLLFIINKNLAGAVRRKNKSNAINHSQNVSTYVIYTQFIIIYLCLSLFSSLNVVSVDAMGHSHITDNREDLARVQAGPGNRTQSGTRWRWRSWWLTVNRL